MIFSRLYNSLIDVKLSTKALLATIIPFLVNVAWLIAMWGNSLQVEQLGIKEKEQADFMEAVTELTQQYYLLQGTFSGALLSLNNHDKRLFNSASDLFLEHLENVNSNPQLRENQKGFLNELGGFARTQKVVLAAAFKHPEEDRWDKFIELRRSVMARLKDYADDKRSAKDFLVPQRMELDRLRSEQNNRQKLFLTLLFCGVSANFVIALILHFLFGRYVTSRIDVLAANAKALSHKGTMLTPLSGRDDFAIVDEALHDSARQIDAAFSQKQALMQMIAHDLKSPLSASQVALATMLVRDKASLTEASLKTVNRVSGNNKRLLSLINDLLTIDALELGHLDLSVQPEQVSRCVAEAVETLQASALIRRITINLEVGEEVGLFDYRRILQVLTNLLSNAIKFSHEDSVIVVSCEKIPRDKLKISVKDSGKGIAPKDLPLLFQKYFQTEDGKNASGTGLGLAISKLIIDAHGEEIGVDSERTKGTTFWFTLEDGDADT